MRKFVISSMLLAVAGIANATTTFTWTFSGSNTDLGTTSIFTNNGVSITASGFTSNSTPGDLYGKNLGGNEVGLGLVADPTGNDEIYYKSSSVDFIQLDLTNVIALNITNLQIAMNSTTSGEAWRVYDTSSAGTLVGATTLLNGNDQSLHSISPTLKYLDIVVTGPSPSGNVLLSELTGTRTVPEPSSVVTMLLGLGLIGMSLIKRSRANSRLEIGRP